MQNLSWKTTAALITTELAFVVEKTEQLFPSLERFQTHCAWHPEVSVIFEQIRARYMKRQIPPSFFFFPPLVREKEEPYSVCSSTDLNGSLHRIRRCFT